MYTLYENIESNSIGRIGQMPNMSGAYVQRYIYIRLSTCISYKVWATMAVTKQIVSIVQGSRFGKGSIDGRGSVHFLDVGGVRILVQSRS